MRIFRFLFWFFGFRPYHLFIKSFTRPVIQQDKVLKEILGDLEQTEYGKMHSIHGKETRDQFRRKLPIVNFDEISHLVDQQKKSGKPTLVNDKIVMYECTSGSSGASKYIPISQKLRQSFENMFLIWLYDLFYSKRSISLKTGRVFISVSPSQGKEIKANNKVKIGFEDDTDYLNPFLKWILDKYLVAPLSLKKVKDPFLYKRILCAYLIADQKLEVISIWNPTYLTSLLEFALANKSMISQDLRNGYIASDEQSYKFSNCSETRLQFFGSGHWTLLWPNLKLISCWTDYTAKNFALEIKKIFPSVTLQGKGLLATEAPMTIPLFQTKDPVPLLSEVFMEFEDENGNLYFIDELRKGRVYQIIITQKAGLIRYRIGDQVSVDSFFKNTPCFRFQGRSRSTSDLVGEKLNEIFLMDMWNKKLPFWVLIPQIPISTTEISPNYKLFIEGNHNNPIHFEKELEENLCTSFHYNHARRMRQLKPLKVEVISELKNKYFSFHEDSGMKLGDIKYNPLLSNLDKAKSFDEQISSL